MHSTLFYIFGVPIRAYGLMMVIGFGLGLWRAIRVAKPRGLNSDRVYDLALISLISGVVGARLLYMAITPGFNWRDFASVWNGGLSFHGGILAAILAAVIYTRVTRLNFLNYVDLLTPSVAIGYAFTRIGCFLNGCCYGTPTNLPWGVRFLEDGQRTPPSHPTQIYGFLASMLIFFILTRLEKLNRKPGFILISYLGLYSIYRFLVEFVRVGHVWILGLTQAQVLSLAVAIVSGIVLLTHYNKAAKPAKK